MKKHLFYSLLILIGNFCLQAQDPEVNFQLDFHWADTSLVASNAHLNVYNEVWGMKINDREYGIIGSTYGTHIFDLSEDGSEEPILNIPGAYQGPGVIHRDYHDYNGYLYMVCDEGVAVSTLQIVDMNAMPDTAIVVYDSDELFSASHNIFIDTSSARMYVCGGRTSDFFSFHLQIYDIKEPASPELLLTWGPSDYFYPHDVYVINDTAYLNSAADGLLIMDFNNIDDPQVVGWLEEYSEFGQGYNHSGWLTDDGKRYMMADENWGLKIKTVNLENFDDIFVDNVFGVQSEDDLEIPHNLMITGDYLYISYYTDGLKVYNIANTDSIYEAGNYETSFENRGQYYRGNWGVYCTFESGKILLSDMQEGLYVLDASYPEEEIIDTVGMGINNFVNTDITIYPNPIRKDFQIKSTEGNPSNVQLFSIEEKRILTWEEQNENRFTLEDSVAKGVYFIQYEINNKPYTSKIIIE